MSEIDLQKFSYITALSFASFIHFATVLRVNFCTTVSTSWTVVMLVYLVL